MTEPNLTELEWSEIYGALTFAEITMERRDDKISQVERIRGIRMKIYRAGLV